MTMSYDEVMGAEPRYWTVSNFGTDASVITGDLLVFVTQGNVKMILRFRPSEPLNSSSYRIVWCATCQFRSSFPAGYDAQITGSNHLGDPFTLDIQSRGTTGNKARFDANRPPLTDNPSALSGTWMADEGP